ncbi:uncharacterized protein BJ212DRAFT_785104 [Suillus subaureus]|uniref:Uncharacterized protein n=1 Tax=Suillus subaureus TaxID=48587 RepID=A0A9P7DYK1_9AGAM|nr:uncharacterized protein BJ212DRAFT_785104 [Suillus subaureus]KAG1806180.1 hypothetical protein BJ212DRAFT_785104 [Suillus subaureus]
MMATIPFNDSASGIFDPPPSYDAIYMPVSTNSIQCKRSVFSFLQSKQKCRRALVLSRIHAIVSSPDFTPSSVAQIVKSCAAALPAAEFSNLLQKPNIEDHSALYWAIVNNQRETLLEFTKFILKFSPACSSDLRLACMTVNDHDSFMLLNLGDIVNPKDRSLRRMLRCPQDDIQVYEGDDMDQNRFFVCFVFRMFQKRLRITQKFEVEFVARGRIWALRLYMGEKGKWCIEYCLSGHSLPVHPNAVLQIQSNKPPPGSDTPKHLRLVQHTSGILITEESFHHGHITDKEAKSGFLWQFPDDWPMDDPLELRLTWSDLL